MSRLQVTCINKQDRDSASERISHIGGYGWKHTEDTAIFNIKNGINEYYVSKNGSTVKVIIATRNGREYLKTEIDGTTADNLLSLPQCP